VANKGRRHVSADEFQAILDQRRAEGPAPSGGMKGKPAIEIGEPDQPVRVWGKTKRKLTGAQYRAIAALLESGPGGLSLADMDQEFGGKGWRTTLIRLKKGDEDFRTAILFPGKGYPGKDSELYRIAYR
jgi:hypothetical protein